MSLFISSVLSDTDLLLPTFALVIVPVPDKARVSEPTKLDKVKSDETALVVPS